MDTRDVVRKFDNSELIVMHDCTLKHRGRHGSEVLEFLDYLLDLIADEIQHRDLG
ncbi:hypothetical protein [Halobacillus ihumii]|uniref:hypothetical protein n=1 Tax=Halobacillus ihumii TaxID=2686092 RepID=UPI0013D1E5B3|nr:hypothetical protein [Halobacillus ihumii]